MTRALTQIWLCALHVSVMSQVVLSLAACTGRIDSAEKQTTPSTLAIPTQTAQDIALTGILTLRGPNIEAWWGVRAQDGKLWRLVPSNAQIKADFQRLNNQAVQLEGKPPHVAEQGVTHADFPTLLVTRVFIQNPP